MGKTETRKKKKQRLLRCAENYTNKQQNVKVLMDSKHQCGITTMIKQMSTQTKRRKNNWRSKVRFDLLHSWNHWFGSICRFSARQAYQGRKSRPCKPRWSNGLNYSSFYN